MNIEIEKLSKEGKTQREIANFLNLTLSYVNRFMVKNNIGNRKNVVDKKHIPLIKKMYSNGKGSKFIGSHFGYNHITILKICEDIKRDGNHKITLSNKAKALDLYNSGITNAKIISEIMNTNATNVRNWLKGYKFNLASSVKKTDIEKAKKAKKINNVTTKITKKVENNKKTILTGKILELRSQGMDVKKVAEKLNINISTVYAYSKGHSFKKPKVVKPKMITPAIIGNSVMQKGVIRKDDTLEVQLRNNRDEGRLVKLLYSDIGDNPTVRAEIRVKDSVSDQEAVDRWGKKYGKKSVKLIK